jgi:Mce-associated membrane protein
VQTQDAGQEASAAAERALPVILSYDYRHLQADRDQAARFLSSKYRKEYTATFNKLIESSGSNPGPAEQTKAVVKATVENIGVVDAETGVAKVIVFLNQATVKDGGTPKYSLNRLTVSMVKAGNSWLVDNINSY